MSTGTYLHFVCRGERPVLPSEVAGKWGAVLWNTKWPATVWSRPSKRQRLEAPWVCLCSWLALQPNGSCRCGGVSDRIRTGFFLAQVGRQLARGRSDRPKGVRSKGWGIISEIQMLVWTGSRIKGGEMLPCTGSEMTALLCHRGVSPWSPLPETSSKWEFLHNVTATAFSLHLNRTEPLQSSLSTASSAVGLFQPTA